MLSSSAQSSPAVPARTSHRPSSRPKPSKWIAETLKKFQHEVEEYVELAGEGAEARSRRSRPDPIAEEIAAHQEALTQAIVAYRKGEKQGDIFKPAVEAAIRRILDRGVLRSQRTGADRRRSSRGTRRSKATRCRRTPPRRSRNRSTWPSTPSTPVPLRSPRCRRRSCSSCRCCRKWCATGSSGAR